MRSNGTDNRSPAGDGQGSAGIHLVQMYLRCPTGAPLVPPVIPVDDPPVPRNLDDRLPNRDLPGQLLLDLGLER